MGNVVKEQNEKEKNEKEAAENSSDSAIDKIIKSKVWFVLAFFSMLVNIIMIFIIFV